MCHGPPESQKTNMGRPRAYPRTAMDALVSSPGDAHVLSQGFEDEEPNCQNRVTVSVTPVKVIWGFLLSSGNDVV